MFILSDAIKLKPQIPVLCPMARPRPAVSPPGDGHPSARAVSMPEGQEGIVEDRNIHQSAKFTRPTYHLTQNPRNNFNIFGHNLKLSVVFLDVKSPQGPRKILDVKIRHQI